MSQALTLVIANAVGILAGTIFGRLWAQHLLNDHRDQIMRALGLVVGLVGLKMAWPLSDPVAILLSLVFGGWVGAALDLDGRIQQWGRRLEQLTGDSVVQGFVTASMIFNIGAMAVVGTVQAALSPNHSVLIIKIVLDTVTAALLAGVMGWGVALASPFTLLYEGLLVVMARVFEPVIHGQAFSAFVVVGGIIITTIGINFIANRTIFKVLNLTPALILSFSLVWVYRLVTGHLLY